MMQCRVVRRHLDALVDGELDTSAQVEFDSHLSSCPICRDHAAFSRAVKRTVKAELGSAKAPDRLRLRVLTALESAPDPRVSAARRAGGASAERRGAEREASDARRGRERGGVRVWMMPARYAVPAAAAAVLIIAIGARTDDGEADDAAVAATTVPLFDDVVRRHSSEHPAEIAGPPQQVVRWFHGKLEFPVRPVELGSNARLLGARLSNVRDRDAAAFYYDVSGHRVTVMIFEPPQRGLAATQPFVGAERVHVHGRELYYRQVRGYTVPVVQYDGLTYAFTGDLDRQSMIQLAASARVAH